MNLGEALLQSGDEVEKILEWQVGVQSAHDVKFSDRFAVAGGRGFESFFERHGVGAGRVFFSAKGTQAASRDTYVGWVNVAIDVEIGTIAMHPLAHQICHPTDG